MCGIVGIYAFNEIGRFSAIKLSQATEKLQKRGPDTQSFFGEYFVHLGHTRLAIIDLDSRANQPMNDESQRFTIIYNGEVYNFKEIKQELQNQGFNFFSESDTEIVLKSYIYWGEKCLEKFNGFFAFAIYDKETEELFLARDRFGIKPLLFFQDEDKFVFASEMKALLSFGVPKELDYITLFQYLHLNYIPSPFSILKNVQKLEAGHFCKVKKGLFKIESYVKKDEKDFSEKLNYSQAKEKLLELLENSVKSRLISDVPLGAFLSGGIDSSVITALATRYTEKLNTFSIGYKDEKFFDETNYANAVAKKFNTNHTVFSLSNQDLYDHLFEVLDYLDEPFADSSALAVYILSKYTQKKVKVALSGDGADELLAGYNKHWAEFSMRNQGLKEKTISKLLPLWQKLPKSRNNVISNRVRQFQKFAEGSKLDYKTRYWQWVGFANDDKVLSLFSENSLGNFSKQEYQNRKNEILQWIDDDFNNYLKTDLKLVLVGDMLRKVDLMSMANSLEVRVPFLDKNVVDFTTNLPVEYKINTKIRKRILQDAFKEILPQELYNRPKKGFEIPLLKWLRTELKDLIVNDLLSESFIKEQGVFNYTEIQKLLKQLFSKNPEDSHARVWGLLIFQYWWKKYFQ